MTKGGEDPDVTALDGEDDPSGGTLSQKAAAWVQKAKSLVGSLSPEGKKPPVEEKPPAEAPPEPSGPLLYLRLTVQNKLNGWPVVRPGDPSDAVASESDRAEPRRLSSPKPVPPPPTRWTVDYEMKEAAGHEAAHRLLAMCRERRRRLLNTAENEFSFFLKMRRLSEQGELFRKGVDEATQKSKTGKVVYGQ